MGKGVSSQVADMALRGQYLVFCSVFEALITLGVSYQGAAMALWVQSLVFYIYISNW